MPLKISSGLQLQWEWATSRESSDVASSGVLFVKFGPLHEEVVGEVVQDLSAERETRDATDALHEHDRHVVTKQLQYMQQMQYFSQPL